MAATLDAESARAALSYDPATGSLIWRRRSDVSSRWNTKHAGKTAGFIMAGQYRMLTLHNKMLTAHRVIFLLQAGRWPAHQLDHINGDKQDNRWSNLREATPQENMWNRTPRPQNKTGFRGVCWNRKARKWEAKIRLNGKSVYLGLFDTPEAAGNAYLTAAQDAHGAFFHAAKLLA